MMDWNIKLPAPKPTVERPPFDAAAYPLGTIAEKDGVLWYVVWDNQDKRHFWNDKNEDI